MEFGVLGLEGLVGPNCSDPSADSKLRWVGSGFGKNQRSGCEEDEWRALKMAKTVPFHQSNQGQERSGNGFSDDQQNRPQEHMLSFSLSNSEPKVGGFPCYQPRSAGYGTAAGSLVSSSMHGYFGGIRGPFSPSQWSELQHQALIYKYITANVPIPSNLLIPVKRSFNAYGLSYPSNSFGWGSFPLGFSGNTDPEPGRCRRTDGKKWRCSRDAVADQKYCDRHINRGRHRSRKPVEGQTGHAASVAANSKVASPMNPPLPTSVIQQPVKRMQERQSLYLKPEDTNPFQESPQLDFGLVSSDSLLNPSKNMASFLDFTDQETRDQHHLRQFMDDWPKDQSTCPGMAWPEELKSDWTQLSMSIPEALPDLALSWKDSMGGPLGEALKNRNTSELNLLAERRERSPELRSSPTGVLQKVVFGAVSNSSSGESPRADSTA